MKKKVLFVKIDPIFFEIIKHESKTVIILDDEANQR